MPPDRLGDYLRDLQALFDAYGYEPRLYGHFGDGCMHARINFDLTTSRASQHWRDFLDEAADLVVRYGGSLSGEHGDGQARGELLPKMFGPELVQAFREFKAIWDPQSAMNPGKVVDPYPIDDRTSASARATSRRKLEDLFRLPERRGELRRARCSAASASASAAATTAGERMCPSYMVTREEKHSTRGRARLLFEMLHGEVDRRRLAQRRGEGGARPLPRLQGLQERLPGQRRHGDLQGRVPLALLRRAGCGRGTPTRWA